MEIIIRIEVSLIWWTNFDCKGNGGKNLFLPNRSTNIMYPNEENMIVVPNNEKNGDYYECPSLSHFAKKL